MARDVPYKFDTFLGTETVQTDASCTALYW